jgi:hypothetical protein
VTPAVGPDEVLGVLRNVHLGLSLRGPDSVSRHSFPVRITDYLELGVPVLVTPESEAGRLVNRLGLGYCCDHDDVPSMVSFVRQMAQRGDAYRVAREKVVQWRGCFSRRRSMRRFRSYLHQILHGAPGAEHVGRYRPSRGAFTDL